MNYLELACDQLGIDESKVMAYKIYEDRIALVIDNGIKGCPKYVLQLDDLKPVKPETLPEPVVVAALTDKQEEAARGAFGNDVVVVKPKSAGEPPKVTTAGTGKTEVVKGSYSPGGTKRRRGQ